MSPLYKQVLVIGATSGIGRAMATRFIDEGSKVIAVGRRQDRLDAFVKEHGPENASSATLDIGDLKSIPEFVKQTTTHHPNLDCILLNAGIQHHVDLSQPASIDRAALTQELTTNYLAFVHLTLEFLPFLQQQTPKKTTLIYTGSNLSLIPAVTLSGYSASKAALNAFVLCLRRELAHAGSNVEVVEISPPVVQTELHDYRGEGGRAMGMPVGKFAEEAYEGLVAGKDQIVIGDIGGRERFNRIVDERREVFEGLAKMMLGH